MAIHAAALGPYVPYSVQFCRATDSPLGSSSMDPNATKNSETWYAHAVVHMRRAALKDVLVAPNVLSSTPQGPMDPTDIVLKYAVETDRTFDEQENGIEKRMFWVAEEVRRWTSGAHCEVTCWNPESPIPGLSYMGIPSGEEKYMQRFVIEAAQFPNPCHPFQESYFRARRVERFLQISPSGEAAAVFLPTAVQATASSGIDLSQLAVALHRVELEHAQEQFKSFARVMQAAHALMRELMLHVLNRKERAELIVQALGGWPAAVARLNIDERTDAVLRVPSVQREITRLAEMNSKQLREWPHNDWILEKIQEYGFYHVVEPLRTPLPLGELPFERYDEVRCMRCNEGSFNNWQGWHHVRIRLATHLCSADANSQALRAAAKIPSTLPPDVALWLHDRRAALKRVPAAEIEGPQADQREEELVAIAEKVAEWTRLDAIKPSDRSPEAVRMRHFIDTGVRVSATFRRFHTAYMYTRALAKSAFVEKWRRDAIARYTESCVVTHDVPAANYHFRRITNDTPISAYENARSAQAALVSALKTAERLMRAIMFEALTQSARSPEELLQRSLRWKEEVHELNLDAKLASLYPDATRNSYSVVL